MGAVETLRDALFGNPPSPTKEPSREGVLAAFTELQKAIGTVGLGSVDVVKTTKALLDADLAHDAGTTGLVFADGTDANNDLYTKSGASGSGAWTNTGALHGIMGALAEPVISAAEDATDAAGEAIESASKAAQSVAAVNLWPDDYFQLSGGDKAYADGARLYTAAFQNRASWDGSVPSPFGFGAWVHDASDFPFGFNIDLAHPAMADIDPEDPISVGLVVKGPASNLIYGRLYKYVSDASISDVADTIEIKSLALTGGYDLLTFENVSIPTGSSGLALTAYCHSLYLADFNMLGVMVVQGDKAPQFIPARSNADVLRKLVESGSPAQQVSRPSRIAGARLARRRAFNAKRLLGEAARYVVGVPGDSWSASSSDGLGRLAQMSIALYGNGGPGACVFGFTGTMAGNQNTEADAQSTIQRSYTGTWASNYHAGSTSPNLSDIRSSTAGSRVRLRNVAGANHPALSNAVLHFTGTADGVIRWRWGAGAWSADTNVQGGVGVQQTLSLAGFPTGALVAAAFGTWDLEIELVSGSVILCLTDLQSTASGIVFHMLGSSGSAASHWTAISEAQWAAGFAALNCDGVEILLGTNDAAAGVASGLFADRIREIAERVLAAEPSVDVLLTVPPENLDGNAVAMSDYAQAVALITQDLRVAFLDLQPAFGRADAPEEYGPASARQLMGGPGDPHPYGDAGALAVACERDLMWRVG